MFLGFYPDVCGWVPIRKKGLRPGKCEVQKSPVQYELTEEGLHNLYLQKKKAKSIPLFRTFAGFYLMIPGNRKQHVSFIFF